MFKNKIKWISLFMESCQSGLMCRSRKAMRCKPPAVRIRHSPPIYKLKIIIK